ncbi:MAG: CDP-alcohol phosphatidyltransferase family protein, partial [Porticoccaceae bacterium]
RTIAMEKFTYSVPNLLSLLRLILVPLLAIFASLGEVAVFLSILAVSLISDMLDGYFARRLHQTTELGARLDSWADMLTYAVMILGLYFIWPQLFFEQIIYICLAALSYVLPVLLSLYRFAVFPSYHTWGAKLTAVLIAPAYYLLVLYEYQTFFQLVILFHLLVAVEEMAITLILKRPKTNIHSIFQLRDRAVKK